MPIDRRRGLISERLTGGTRAAATASKPHDSTTNGGVAAATVAGAGSHRHDRHRCRGLRHVADPRDQRRLRPGGGPFAQLRRLDVPCRGSAGVAVIAAELRRGRSIPVRAAGRRPAIRESASSDRLRRPGAADHRPLWWPTGRRPGSPARWVADHGLSRGHPAPARQPGPRPQVHLHSNRGRRGPDHPHPGQRASRHPDGAGAGPAGHDPTPATLTGNRVATGTGVGYRRGGTTLPSRGDPVDPGRV